MDVDAILREIGQFGPFQRLNYVVMSSAWIPGAFATLAFVFTNAAPTWHCVEHCVNGTGPGCTTGFVANCSSVYESWKKSHEPGMFCSLPDRAYAFDSPASHRVNIEFGLTCDDSWVSSFLTSVFFMGYFFGSGIFGYLADRWGRRRVVTLTGSIFALSILTSAFVNSAWLYVCCQFAIGVGVGGFGIAAFILGNEFIGPSYRSATGTNASAFFSVGEIILAGVAYFIRGWRALAVCTAVSVVPFIFYPLFVPESPRWLVAAGKNKEATKVMRFIARSNGKSMPMAKIREIGEEEEAPPSTASYSAGSTPVAEDQVWDPSAADDAETKSSSSGSGEGEEEDDVNHVSIRDIFAHKELRKRTLLMMLVWFANSFGYYGLSLDTASLGGSAYLNLLLSSLAEIPALPLASWLLDKIGRRTTTITLMLFSGACCALGVFLPPTPAFHAIRVAVFSAGKFAVAGSFGALYVYGVELFPTSVRSAAVGMSSQAARIGGVVAPIAVFLDRVFAGFSFALFGLVLIVAGISVCFLPETRGMPLVDHIADVGLPSESLLRASGATEIQTTVISPKEADSYGLLDGEHHARR